MYLWSNSSGLAASLEISVFLAKLSSALALPDKEEEEEEVINQSTVILEYKNERHTY